MGRRRRATRPNFHACEAYARTECSWQNELRSGPFHLAADTGLGGESSSGGESVSRGNSKRGAGVVLARSMEEPDLAGGRSDRFALRATKAPQTLYARFFRALYGTPVGRGPDLHVYGPGQLDRAKVVTYSIFRGLDRQAADRASGERPVDWIHVDDVARGLIALTVGEVVARMAAKLAAPPPSLGARPDRPLEAVRRTDGSNLRAHRPSTGGDSRPCLDSTIA